MFPSFFTSTKVDLKYRLVIIYCLYVINYFEWSNIGVIARRLNLHISNRFTLDFVPRLPICSKLSHRLKKLKLSKKTCSYLGKLLKQ